MVGALRRLGRWPLPVVRAAGWLLGHVLWLAVPARRRVALRNVQLCFPQRSPPEQAALVRAHFVAFAQAWVDRGWLWEASEAVVAQRVRLVGQTQALAGSQPLVVFGPHFVGMDAAWMALVLHQPRRCCGLYARQDDAWVDAWMARGRQRFGQPLVLPKEAGVKPLAKAVREGMPLYLLPDMDHGLRDAVWARFFGVQAATLTSLPRLAALGRAQVVALRAELTPSGYDVHVHPVWSGYPSGDVQADAQRMNEELERLIALQPAQYYWVHKRFKTRPSGEAPLYG